MGNYKEIGISQEDYNTALFEAGCEATDKLYGVVVAATVRRITAYWKWLRTQQDIVDKDYVALIEKIGSAPTYRAAFDMYYEMLKLRLNTIYPPSRLDKIFTKKEVCNG